MIGFLQWAYFIIVPLAAAWVALFVWARFEIRSFALIAGTLVGAALSLGVSAIFWNDVDGYRSYLGEGGE